MRFAMPRTTLVQFRHEHIFRKSNAARRTIPFKLRAERNQSRSHHPAEFRQVRSDRSSRSLACVVNCSFVRKADVDAEQIERPRRARSGLS